MDERRILSVLVKNRAGVLTRVAGLFARRGYNIESLSVGETEEREYSRITIVVSGDEYILEQIKKQLAKLIDVVRVMYLPSDGTVCRELVLVKVSASPEVRWQIVETATIFRAKIVDVSALTLTIELTGDQGKTNAFLNLLAPYGVREVTRTGLTAVVRGDREIRDFEDEE
jgi:acetolactate synthase I/III small subunit